ncbi:ABC transporter ATP-binding protein [Lacibacterium aquatile]|uniref:ABC transporter ATP-binding protein n=1 Tax=Lacibacterium aquatile TaxID=1168082 RepID=A0ABW5DWB4_9PROT
MSALHVESLSVALGGRTIINSLTLPAIPSGAVTALVGPNAAGKSTLLRAIAGLIPSKGGLRWGEMDLQRASLADRAGQIAFMPQALPAGVQLRVLETVVSALMAAPSGQRPRSSALAREQALAILQRLDIEGLALISLDTLSGGQRQMVGLAQAIVRNPRLLLLDEPTSALDLRHQTRVMSIARDMADKGAAVVAVLHDLALAARWADRILVLNGGHLKSAGSPEQAITPAMLAEVYGVSARVEPCSMGRLQVLVDATVEKVTSR